LVGSPNQPFPRHVEFETTFPDLKPDYPDSVERQVVRNRHANRLDKDANHPAGKPDPQVISRKLFTRLSPACRTKSECYKPDPDQNYLKAPWFNVLAAFWIQFMTHDWFSHLQNGHNDDRVPLMPTGCKAQLVNNVEMPLSDKEAAKLGCNPNNRIDQAYIAEKNPGTFKDQVERDRLLKAYKTTQNTVTAWWDASQIYGYDQTSLQRVKR